MEAIRSVLPLIGESFAYLLLLLLGWRELRELKRLRLEREASLRAENNAPEA